MKDGVPLLLVAAGAATVVALTMPWASPRPGRAAPGGEMWRYLANVPATRAGGEAAAGAGQPGGIAQCLWPRAVSGDAAGAARSEALASNIGLAFCLRVPAATAGPGAAAPARPTYRM